jgi:hypothetical protein
VFNNTDLLGILPNYNFNEDTGGKAGVNLGLLAHNIVSGRHGSIGAQVEKDGDHGIASYGLFGNLVMRTGKASVGSGYLYAQGQANLTYRRFTGSTGNNLLTLDLNTFSVNLDGINLGKDFVTDYAIKTNAKFNFLDDAQGSAVNYVRIMNGASDLVGGQRLSAFWVQPSATLRWDDSSSNRQQNITVYGKFNLTPTGNESYNQFKDKYRVGASISNSIDTSLAAEYALQNGSLDIYAGQGVKISDKFKLNFNVGVRDVNRKTDNPGIIAGVGGIGEVWGITTNIGIVVHWDHIGKKPTPFGHTKWGDHLQWTGLEYNATQGPQQLTNYFRFSTQAFLMEKGNTLVLRVGTGNSNGVGGVIFSGPSGPITDVASVWISDAKIYDNDRAPSERLLAGAGQALVGRTLDDIINNPVEISLPNVVGEQQFTIELWCASNTGDYPRPPAVGETTIAVQVERK